MVSVQEQVKEEIVKVLQKLADSLIDHYRIQEPGADLEKARGHLRNARNHFRDGHLSAAARNFERAIEAANEAGQISICQRLEEVLGQNFLEIAKVQNDYGEEDTLLSSFEKQLRELREEVRTLPSAKCWYLSTDYFERAASFSRRVQERSAWIAARAPIRRQIKDLRKRIEQIREENPAANSQLLQSLEDELVHQEVQIAVLALSEAEQRAREVQQRLDAAFRARSKKNLKNRGKPRVTNRHR